MVESCTNMNVLTEIDRFKLKQVKEYSVKNIPHNFQKHPTRKNANSKPIAKCCFPYINGCMAHNVVGLITLALLLEVVARRALAVTVVVAPPAQLVAPGSRAPNLTRPGDVLLIAAFSVEMAAILNVNFRPLKSKFEFANIDIRIQ